MTTVQQLTREIKGQTDVIKVQQSMGLSSDIEHVKHNMSMSICAMINTLQRLSAEEAGPLMRELHDSCFSTDDKHSMVTALHAKMGASVFGEYVAIPPHAWGSHGGGLLGDFGIWWDLGLRVYTRDGSHT